MHILTVNGKFEITSEVSRMAGVRFPKDKVRETLTEGHKIHPHLPKWYTFYSRNEKGEHFKEKRKGRCYVFYEKDWIQESVFDLSFSETIEK